MMPSVNPIRAMPQANEPTDEELDREIFLLEKEILAELEETAELQKSIESKLSDKTDKS